MHGESWWAQRAAENVEDSNDRAEPDADPPTSAGVRPGRWRRCLGGYVRFTTHGSQRICRLRKSWRLHNGDDPVQEFARLAEAKRAANRNRG